MNPKTLDAGVTIFIRQKVQQLGSIDAVNRFYIHNCVVNNYARQVAQEMYSNPNNLNSEHAKTTFVINTEPKIKEDYKYRSEIKAKKIDKDVDISLTKLKTSIRYCVSCGLPIPSARLQAIPGATQCMECKKDRESKKGHHHRSKDMFCPRCKQKGFKSLLVWRTARDPSVRSSYFLGCSRYPKCQYIDK